jgi:ribosomal-protein-alanine N-acetyltransferase
MTEQGASGVVCRLSRLAASELAIIEAESNDPPWSEKLFTQEFSNDFSHTFGVRSEGILAGFLVIHTAADEGHIVNFGVRRASRGRGLGRVLLETVLRDLHTRAIRWVTLEVRRSNAVAQKLYTSVGFSEVGIRQRYYSNDGEDALVFKLNVDEFVAGFARGEGR